MHVRNRCEPVFNQRAGGLPWPEHLHCDNYEDIDLCFGPGVEELSTATIPADLGLQVEALVCVRRGK